ncbi:hypothetical protein E2C01_041623 [Portunus trituberculatus]|uniref:Uncharacterized protein n=1 Tax=Portunus trituberculatus TaxID=210409 RepID=A0A5B7FU76_PORTR|nr:hypothetical protein [Portunus trituberculatus]
MARIRSRRRRRKRRRRRRRRRRRVVSPKSGSEARQASTPGPRRALVWPQCQCECQTDRGRCYRRPSVESVTAPLRPTHAACHASHPTNVQEFKLI